MSTPDTGVGQPSLPQNTQPQIQTEAPLAPHVTVEPLKVQPTLPPAPRTNGALLFSDDCDGSGKAQAMFDSKFMNFAEQSGQCVITANSKDFVLPAMYAATSLVDFIIEYDLNMDLAKPKSKYSLIFRSDDIPGGLKSYYMISLFPIEQGVEFAVWNADKWTLKKVTSVPGSFSPQGLTQVRMESFNTSFRVFLNGSFAAEFLDDQIPIPGILGLSITSTNPPESFQYDNLKIYEIGS